jgi:hypothetical protein
LNSALPEPLTRFWAIAASEDYALGLRSVTEFYGVIEALTAGKWNSVIRDDLIAVLTPVLRLRKPWPMSDVFEGGFTQYAEPEVALRSEDISHWVLDKIRQHPQRSQILIDLADDLTRLLKRVMDLYQSVDKASATFDLSYVQRPSIDDHGQNVDVESWSSSLMPLLRDSFMELREHEPNRGKHLVDQWRNLPYPLFRRFTFYGMAKSNLFKPKACLNALLDRDAHWLWAINTQREAFQLLESLWPKLDGEGSALLIRTLLAGPPRGLFRSDLDADSYDNIVEQEIFTRLRALNQTRKALPLDAQTRFDQLSERWQADITASADRDHFPTWMETSYGDPLRRHVRPEEDLRKKSDEVVMELLTHFETSLEPLAYWSLVVSDQTERATRLLLRVADERNVWPLGQWRDLLWAIQGCGARGDLWNDVCATLRRFPHAAEIADPAAFLLREISKSIPLESEECFWAVWDMIIGPILERPDEEITDPVTTALNSSPGALAETALNRINAREGTTAAVPDAIWNRMTKLLLQETASASLAATILASRLGNLFKLNPDWTRDEFIQKFDWEKNANASALWQGYFWQFLLPPDLWPLLKDNFLTAVGRSNDLGSSAEPAASWFTVICIDRSAWITHAEATQVLTSMNPKSRSAVAHLLWRRLEQAAAGADELWRDKIGPWLRDAWPRKQNLIAPSVSLNLALAVISTHDEFPNAVAAIREFIGSSRECHLLIYQVQKSSAQLADLYPRELLELLGRLVDPSSRSCDRHLRELLDQIAAACPECRARVEYRELDEYLRSFSC